jgi:hypothetical protein
VQCRNCGTEIADKAIICFRCGQGTTDPVRKPAAIRPARRGGASFAAPILAILVSLILLVLSRSSAYPRTMTATAGILAAAAAILLIARLLRRR